LDATNWHKWSDFYDALLSALEAPDWHGYNLDALLDSMVWGGINIIEPPYTIRVHNLDAACAEAREQFDALTGYVAEHLLAWRKREGTDKEIVFEIVS
jgi:RNAse (barnase) inhibitor barstar